MLHFQDFIHPDILQNPISAIFIKLTIFGKRFIQKIIKSTQK